VTDYHFFSQPEECMPWPDLEALQLKKALWTLRRLYTNNPLYKAKLDEAGIHPEDIRSFAEFPMVPYTTKQDFLASYPDKLLCVPYPEIVRMHCTSGTTGRRPTCGYYTRHDLEEWTKLCARNLACIGMTSSDVFQNTTSAGLFTGGFGYAQGATLLGAMLIPFGPGMTSKQLQFMRDFRVTSFHAIPSFALRLAEQVAEENIDLTEYHLRVAIVGAEGWAESTRKKIEQGLGIKAYDNYGLTEACGPGVAVECPEQHGLHIWSDYFYPEIIDPVTGDVLGEGETGELVLTSLWKEALPIFRYRTGDITTMWRSDCACGRTGYVMERIKGRLDDMHVIKGVNIYPSMIEQEVFDLPYFSDNYMIVFHTVGVMDQITTLVELREGQNEVSAKKELEKNLLEATMLHIEVKTFPPGTLPRQEGKAVRHQDVRDRPDGFKGWLKMFQQN
jgi:phenylacetate-CoA ligase